MPANPPARTPLVRVLRTVVQVLVALVAVLPATVAALAAVGVHVDGALLAALAGAAVLVVTAVQNGIEHAGPGPVYRTIVQVAVALAAVVPATIAALAAGGVHVDETGLAAVVGCAVLLATTVQNLLEHREIIPAMAIDTTGRANG